MTLTLAVTEFAVFLVSASVIQGQNEWKVTYTPTEICALEGSTVEMNCTYTHPSTGNDHDTAVKGTLWFIHVQGKEPEDLRTNLKYSGRVQSHCENNICTLRIRDVRESDSAEYKFMLITNQPGGRFTGSPGVTLSVTGLKVLNTNQNPCKTGSCTWSELKCNSCLPGGTSFIWYKNGETFRTGPSVSYSDYFYPADSYSCAVKGHEDFAAPSKCGHGNSCNRVRYTNRNICAFEGSSVNIPCVYFSNEDITSAFWFNNERRDQWYYRSQPEDLCEDSQYEGRVHAETKRSQTTLTITDLRKSDSAQYHFKFKTQSFEWRSSLPGTTLTVTDPDLQVQVIWSSSGPKLICHSSCLTDHSSFVWYKNETEIQEEMSLVYSGNIDPADSYSCAYKSYRSSTVYAPKPPSVSVSPSGDIVKNRSVTLTCSSDANPTAKYTWYKRNQNVLNKEQQLVFESVQPSDSGVYYCTAENDLGKKKSESVYVDVKYAPKTSFLSVNPSGEIVEGSSVTLTCCSDANPAANYTWYKENQILSQGPEDVFHLTSISSEDRGNYYCKTVNQYGQIKSSSLFIDVQYAPKLPSVSVSPSGDIMKNSSVTLTCSSDANPAANYTWYKENEDLPKASGQIFIITNFRAEDSGNYYCEAQNKWGRHHSTLHLSVAGNPATMMNIIRLTLVILMLIPLVLLSLWTRKKKSLSSTMKPHQPPQTTELHSCSEYENVSSLTGTQTEDTEEHEEVM